MNIMPISCAYNVCKSSTAPNFKAIVTGNIHSKDDGEETVHGYDSGHFPISHSCYYETVLHDYYELIDETPDSFKESCQEFPNQYVSDYEDRTQGIEFFKKDIWNKLGKLPIKVSEWIQYTHNKETMPYKDVAFIEKVLTRYNLQHLIR